MTRTTDKPTVANAGNDQRVQVEWGRFCAELRRKGHTFSDREQAHYLSRIAGHPNPFNAMSVLKRRFEGATSPLSKVQQEFAKQHGLTPAETRRQFARTKTI